MADMCFLPCAKFEKAATVGVVVVVALSAIVIYKAVALGFPAIKSGELPLFDLKVDSNLPEAFAVLGFAFYMQVGSPDHTLLRLLNLNSVRLLSLLNLITVLF